MDSINHLTSIFIKKNIFNRVILLITSLLFSAFVATECRGYDGLIFDAMAQLDEKQEFISAINKVQQAKVSKLALFARSRKYLGENENKILELREKFPELIILGTPKYFLLRNDLTPKYITKTIRSIQKHNYKFIGEILYTHGDKSHGEKTLHGERYIDPIAPNNIKFINLLRRPQIPVMTHWEVYEWDRDWPKFSELYNRFPEITFIIPHMAFGHPEQVRLILSKHSNVYMTISKKEQDKKGYSDSRKSKLLGHGFLNKNGKIRPSWHKLIIDYSDRLMFATDAHKAHRWEKYKEIIDNYRHFAKQLPLEVAKMISYQNAERLYNVKVK
tara:strand:+ start:398 stop:1387 length:990 start_codon:yes stop_codon:yes gene_type:complete